MAGTIKSKASYTFSVIGVSLVLFLLGTMGWIVINGKSLAQVVKEGMAVQIDFHDNVRPESINQMKSILDRQPFTKKSRIITKDEALKMQSELEGTDIEGFLGYNPLFASIELNLHNNYVNKDSIEKITLFIEQSNVVNRVSYPKTIVNQMNENLNKISIILGIISIVLILVVIVLIDNTVRLAMFSNRFLIKTMQMVGATRWFISKPFDQRAIVNGLISGVLSVLGLLLVKYAAEMTVPELKALSNPVLLTLLMLGMVIAGILISLVSTHRSVVKYLKLTVDDLY
ncbi:MAG TPA: permease-like cell division protein FtsX [Chitinophagaceae bacterium]|nr:permease-like cell division protein FtsX [Chitinophagaceae bacterium]